MGILNKILFVICITFLLQSCGGFKRSDVKNNPINDADKRKKNIEEGRGITLGKGLKGGNGNFNFATSNEMWRASLEILDFVPLATVDYGDGTCDDIATKKWAAGSHKDKTWEAGTKEFSLSDAKKKHHNKGGKDKKNKK